jgi:predicted ATPase
MKFKEHTEFMIDFISNFINGKTSRYFFDLDYCARVIEHFPYMERENSEIAERFADTVDEAYERASASCLSDEEFRIEISKAFDKWLGKKKIDII